MVQESQNMTMRYVGLATQWLVMIGIAVTFGYKLDFDWIGWQIPVFVTSLPLIVIVVSLYKLIITFSKKTK